jgi:3,4-dihydroxy 2-butanone 4-phosphate synthase / GTP cyclohydrolase II
MNTPEELIADIRAGKMIILMDDEDRENEGDLIMAAEKVTAQDINFMARFGRGLICLTLTAERCAQLKLPLMVRRNRDNHSTNFTLSIEAAEGVTTGISAADRATTIKAAVAANAKPEDIVMPGHIFPLMAREGGVLTRAGHTEAGCDLARLAGFEPSAAIVEILNEDGSMARRPDLERFATEHGIKLGTVADLIEYRMQREKTVERVAENRVDTRYGALTLYAYQEVSTADTHIAMVRGKVSPDEAVLVRVHMFDTLCDVLGISGEECRTSLEEDLARLSMEDNAILVILRKEQDEVDLVQRINRLGRKKHAWDSADLRMFGVGAQILLDLGVKKMRVLGTPLKLHALSGFGLEIIDYVAHAD